MRQDDPCSVSPEGDNQSCRGNEMMVCRRSCVCSLPQSLLQDDRASCIFLIHSGQEAVGDLYPLTKKNLPFQHVNAWNTFARVLPGGRVERGGGGTKPRNVNCFNMLIPAFDDNDTSGGQRWAYPWCYALNGQTLPLNYCEQLKNMIKTVPP